MVVWTRIKAITNRIIIGIVLFYLFAYKKKVINQSFPQPLTTRVCEFWPMAAG